jgi:trk system potassium uptake protein TrkH
MCLGEMSLFDSLCHAFGTVSTSGYSPYNASIGHSNSADFDGVITLFMFLGGVTFMLFFCVGVTGILWWEGSYGFLDSLRYGTLQVTSILTATGFTTTDYEVWPHAAQMLLVVVCFIGACAGSTTSGIKVIHFVLVWKFMVVAIKKIFFQPLSVMSVRVNGLPIDQMVINLALCYFIVNIFMVGIGGFVMVLISDMDTITAMSSVIAALMNIGPGFGGVGPSENYAFISDAGKWFLAWNMLVGRLEMFSALVIFYPSFWRR